MATDIVYYDKDIPINDYSGQEYVNLYLPEGISLENINFRDIFFKNVNFSKIKKMNEFYFNGATFEYCEFGNMLISSAFKGATFRECSFRNSMIYGSNFVDGTFMECNFANAALTASDFRAAMFKTNIFEKGTIKHSDFDSASFYSCFFDSNTVINYGTRLNSINFTSCQFDNITFEDTQMINTHFTSCRFKNIKTFNNIISNIDMKNCVGEIESIGQYVAPVCPTTGSFIGWKKCLGGIIVKLLITEDALRSSGFGRKCRASKVKVLSIESKDGSIKYKKAYSQWNALFEYRIGETIEINNFVKTVLMIVLLEYISLSHEKKQKNMNSIGVAL